MQSKINKICCKANKKKQNKKTKCRDLFVLNNHPVALRPKFSLTQESQLQLLIDTYCNGCHYKSQPNNTY